MKEVDAGMFINNGAVASDYKGFKIDCCIDGAQMFYEYLGFKKYHSIVQEKLCITLMRWQAACSDHIAFFRMPTPM